MRVLFLPEVIDQFLELAEVLYDQGYFGFEDAAQSYAEQLFKEINEQLPLKVKRNAPEFFERYGSNLFYSVFPRNQHTVWYIFLQCTRKRWGNCLSCSSPFKQPHHCSASGPRINPRAAELFDYLILTQYPQGETSTGTESKPYML